MNCFLNISNHPSALWSEKQKAEAEKYGPVIDVAFPAVDTSAGEENIIDMAKAFFSEVIKYKPSAVMCQGEYTLSFCLINMFLSHGIRCLAACTERKAEEKKQEDGTSLKISRFEFVKFREYVKF